MNKLTRIIGLAPSELTREALKEKLLQERERIRRSFKPHTTTKAKITKTTSVKGISTILQEAGLTPAQLIKGLALLKKEKEGGSCER